MSRPESCAYPPRLADDVDIVPREDAGRPRFLIGSAAAGRYLILGAAEHQVVQMLDGAHTPAVIWNDVAELARFLSKLDRAGILAGERSGPAPALLGGNQAYLRWSLVNPDRLFAAILPILRWIWTPWFFAASAILIAAAGMLALTDWPEVAHYSAEVLRHHYVTILLVAWLVTITHEFAHGMTSKAFGGSATEVGALLIYYCLPALYCNVSGLHRIRSRRRRLWVIAAGIYWQLLVGAAALWVWYAFDPGTLAAQLALALVLGSVLDVIFNANPLIKLDGYYFLTQLLGIANLMDRSRACWRGEAGRFPRRERWILLVFGFFSFLYTLALPVVLVWYAAQYLMDRLYFVGLLLSAALALAYAWRPVRKSFPARGGDMKKESQSRRRWIVPASLTAGAVAVLCLPWTASVGGYGTLVAIPGRESVIRAPENATLLALLAQPGQQVERGAAIGRMGNLDLEEQIAQVQSELARVSAESDRLSGELGVQEETAKSVEWQLAQRRREFRDIDAEERQIGARLADAGASPIVRAALRVPSVQGLPPALAVVEANARESATRSAVADRQRDRARLLAAEGILARMDLDAAEARALALGSDAEAARERLQAALIEHQRRQASAETEVNVAGTHLGAERAGIANLRLQLVAARRLRAPLEERLAVLERKRAQFALVALTGGTLFGDDLPRMAGQYFAKGTEICRIADTHEVLVRIQVAEQALGDLALGRHVRVKTRAFPDRTFHGVVSRIGAVSELDGNGQRTYRAELTIQNAVGSLRPGMTVFARVDFGRHVVAWLAAHKLRQALRPELWML